MNWNMSNRFVLILVTGGLVNLGCLAYLILGVTEQTALRSNIGGHSKTLNSLYTQLPPSSHHATLSNQIEVMNRRINKHKKQMVYDFEDAIPNEFDESPAVTVNDQLSKASDKIERMFQSENRSKPTSLGLPTKPSKDADKKTLRRKLRQIDVVTRIIQLLLENNTDKVIQLSSTNAPPEHPIVSRIQNIEGMKILTGPLTITFRAPLASSISVLKQLQSPPSYLQVFDARMSSKNGSGTDTRSGDEQLLELQLTVAPIYQGQIKSSDADETDSSDKDQDESEDTDENDTDSFFGN